MKPQTAAALLFAAVVVSHEQQRYATTGDWLFGESDGQQPAPLKVRVSDMGNPNYAFLVAIHETIEAWLCANAGIAETDVSAFDLAYEEARLEGRAAPCGCVPTETSEPGDDIHAPYFHQHQFATSIERQLCSRLGISWDDYDNANLALYDAHDQQTTKGR